MTSCLTRSTAGRPSAAGCWRGPASTRCTRSSTGSPSIAAGRIRGASVPRLVLIRHGQSTWNLENRFTGWWDVGLTEQGRAEARAAGELLAARDLDFDLCFTSVLARAITTLHIALEAMDRLWLPVGKDW